MKKLGLSEEVKEALRYAMEEDTEENIQVLEESLEDEP